MTAASKKSLIIRPGTVFREPRFQRWEKSQSLETASMIGPNPILEGTSEEGLNFKPREESREPQVKGHCSELGAVSERGPSQSPRIKD